MPLTAQRVQGQLPNFVANRISAQLDLAGPSYTVSAGSASGLVAIEHAARLLTDPGAALLVREGANAPQQVADHISALLAAPDALADMAAKARASALLGAADKLADMVEQEIATP